VYTRVSPSLAHIISSRSSRFHLSVGQLVQELELLHANAVNLERTASTALARGSRNGAHLVQHVEARDADRVALHDVDEIVHGNVFAYRLPCVRAPRGGAGGGSE